MAKYNKFILMSDFRTGSSYLQSLIRSHPNVYGGWELLNEYYFPQKYPMNTIRENWRKYLDEVLWSKGKTLTLIKGFKATYAQIRPMLDEVVEFVETNNVAVIHLVRRNVLNKLLSGELKRITGLWAHKEYPLIQITITPERLKTIIKIYEGTTKKCRQLFGGPNFHELYYEQLTKNQEEEVGKIFQFLGLPFVTPETGFIKQRTRSQREYIANYDELKAAFENTRYSWFFED